MISARVTSMVLLGLSVAVLAALSVWQGQMSVGEAILGAFFTLPIFALFWWLCRPRAVRRSEIVD